MTNSLILVRFQNPWVQLPAAQALPWTLERFGIQGVRHSRSVLIAEFDRLPCTVPAFQ